MKILGRTTVLLAMMTTAAVAADYPNLLGTWTGTSRAVVTGTSGHYVVDGTRAKFVSADLTLEWTEQDDGRLIGTFTSPQYTEVKIGVISQSGDMLFSADNDGTSVGRILGPDRFELCYTHAEANAEVSTASCVIFTRTGS
ncbi:MAG: hypothetical protein AAGF94_02970 [Pseudomonadota bacterium]